MIEHRHHGPSRCAGQTCAIHNPSDHHMKDWPLTIRYDKLGLVERVCEHRVGHPDPDSVAFIESFMGAERSQHAIGIHGCDGCCRKPV